MLGIDTVTGASSNGFSGSTTLGWSHTVSGTDRLLVVAIELWQDVAGTGTVTGMTYNGTAMTQAVAKTQTSMRSEIWYLVAPSTGTNTITATITGATDDRKGASISLTGAHQSNPIHTTATASGSSSPISLDLVTTIDNCYVIDAASNFSTAALTIGANQSTIRNSNSGTSSGASSYEYKAVAGTVTMSWTKTGTDDWATSAVAIRPADTRGIKDSYPYYIYRVYDGATIAGTLSNVVSEFSYSHQVNQAGTQLKITLGYNFDDVGANESVDYVVDESGNFVVDGLGNYVISNLDYVFANQPIDLGNRVIVTKYDEYHFNGLIVFDGIISSWATDYSNATIDLTVLSHGVYLDQYIVNTESDLTVEQLVYDTETVISSAIGPTPADIYAQTFQIGTASNITSISLRIRKTDETKLCLATLELVEGTPSVPGAILGTITGRSIDSTSTGFVDFTFSTPISIAASTTYHFTVTSASGATVYWTSPYISYNSTSVYASGQVYDNLAGAGWVARTRDLTFRVNTTAGSTNGSFLNSSASFLAQTALDIFNAQGGIVTYSSSSIVSGGESIDYTFKLGTIWEALKRAYELAPSTYTLYIDPATNLTYLKPITTTPTHVFVKGKHLTKVNIERTIEGMINTVYFSGGDTGGGQNLYITGSDTLSKANYGQWLDRASDNRVTQTETAETIINSKLSRNSVPFFRTSIAIVSSTYDIESISLGDTVSFAGFNNLIDGLLLAVVGLKHNSNVVELQLGQVMPRQSQRIEKLQRDLIAQQTVNNPNETS